VQGSTPLFLTQKPESEKPKAPPAIDGSVPQQTYRIEVGHEHGVLPGNIVGAIANEAGIEGKHIGHIDIREDHSYVDLPGLSDEMLASLQSVRVRGAEIRIAAVAEKPDKPKFSGASRRPDRMAQSEGHGGERRPYAGAKKFEGGEKRPYIGGGNRFDKAGEPRPYKSERSQSRNYKGTPRFRDDAPRAPAASDAPDRAPERSSRPPRFSTFAEKPRSDAKPSFGAAKPEGFKKKFVGKAAGAKGSYKGGKAFRDKRG
jgi:ATP-dependent RNA helicase DeaD